MKSRPTAPAIRPTTAVRSGTDRSFTQSTLVRLSTRREPTTSDHFPPPGLPLPYGLTVTRTGFGRVTNHGTNGIDATLPLQSELSDQVGISVRDAEVSHLSNRA